MQNKRECGFYNPRVFLAFVLYSAAALLTFIALSFSSLRHLQAEAAQALTRL
jgi:hypothetical protein